MGRRIAWIVAGVLAVIALLGVALVGATSTRVGSGFLARQLERQVGGLLETGDLSIGGVTLSPGGVEVRDLRVHGPEQRDWLVVEEIDAAVAWTELFTSHVHLTSLIVRRPRLRSDAETGIGGPTFPSGDPDAPMTWFPAGWSLAIDAIALSEGELGLPELEVRALKGEGGLEMTHEALTLRPTTLAWSLTNPAVGRVEISAEGRIDGPDLATVQVRGTGPDVTLRGEGSVEGLLADLGKASLTAAVSAGNGGAALLAEAFDASLPPGLGATVALTAEGPLDDAHVGLRAWRTPAARRDLPGIAPGLVASADVSAPLDDRAPRRVELTASTPRPLRVEGLGRLDLDGLEATLVAEGDELTAHGTAVLGTLDLDAVPNTMAGDLAVEYTRSGSSNGRVELDARLADRDDPQERVVLRGTADLDASLARLDALRITPVGAVTWRQDRPTAVRWTDEGIAAVFVDWSSDRGAVTLRADDLARRPFDVDGTVTDLDLAHASTVAERLGVEMPELSGTLQLELATNRTATRPANQWVLDGTASGVSVDEWLREAEAQIAVRVAPRSNAVSVPVTELVAEATATVGGSKGELATLSGSVPILRRGPAAFGLDCGADETRVDVGFDGAVADLEAVVELPEDVPEAGRIRADLVARGDPCDPVLDLDSTVTTPFAGRRVAIGLVGTDDDGELRLRAELRDEGGTPRAGATATASHAPLAQLVRGETAAADAVRDVAVDATLDGLPSSWFLDTLDGRLDGTATARGTGRSLDATRGRVVFAPDPSLGFEEHVELSWDTTADRVVTVTGGAKGAEPRLRARVPLDGDPRTLEGRLRRTALPVAPLLALTDGALVDGEGRVEAEGTIGGTLAEPAVDVRLDVADGGFTLPATGVRYQDVRASGHFEGLTLVVDEMRAASRPERRGIALLDPGDELFVEGTVDLSDGGFEPDLELELDRTWILATSSMILQASGEARLTRAEHGRLLLSGATKVDQGSFETDRTVFSSSATSALHPDIRFVGDGLPQLTEGVEAETEQSAIPTTLSAVDLDLDVNLGDGARLDAAFPLADTAERITATTDASIAATLRGDLAVSQVDGELDLRGRLDVTGDVKLLTARFTVTEGAVAFSGGDLTTPQVDLDLSRETRAYGAVTARVSGTPEDLVVSDLSSDEYGSRGDVIAILLLGRPLDELEPGRGAGTSAAVQGALLAVAGNQVSEVLGTRVVDTVDYDATDGLSLGWQLASNGFLTVSVDPLAEEDESTAEAQFTWLFTDHVEAGIETGDAGTGTAWVVWRDRF